jgi:N-acetylmuramoyl-L-alanine amidase/Tol biopolymer transport system component
MKRLIIPLLATVLLLNATAFGQGCDLTGWRIFIDPGHGGSDPGAIGPTGLQEKEVTLDAGLQLLHWLEGFGAEVSMSRTSDVFIPLTTRADMANSFGAHRFISVHVNGFTDPSANGTEVFVVPNPRHVTQHLGQGTLKYLLAHLGLRNRGLKFANFTVLVRTQMPAALSESAFITNPFEESLLRESHVRGRIAEAHAYAICRNVSDFGEGSNQSDSSGIELESDSQQAQDFHHGSLRIIGEIRGRKGFLRPRFSPDGNHIVFSGAGNKSLYLAAVANLQPQLLDAESAAGINLGWSPDGRPLALTPRRLDLPSAVAYIRDEQLWVEIDGENQQITDDGLLYSDPKLSPMMDKVLVTGRNFDGSGLFVIDLKTKRKFNLSLLGVGQLSGYNLSYAGAWSPDGQRVLFSLTQDDGYTHVASDLYVINYNGANLIQMTNDGLVKLNPDWSVRNQIAFESGDRKIIIAEMP